MILAVCCATSRGDGGTLRIMQRQGPWRIAVFTSPAQPRVGDVDISVLVQDAESLLPVENVEIAVQLAQRAASGRAILAQASRAAATNKLMLSALVEVPTAGTWDVLVACSAGSERHEVACEVEVAEPLPEWVAVWPWFTWPLGVVALFAAHQVMLQRKAVRRANAKVPTAS